MDNGKWKVESGTMDSVKNLAIVKCCVNCVHWDEGNGDYESTCNLDTKGIVFSPAHVCDSHKSSNDYQKD